MMIFKSSINIYMLTCLSFLQLRGTPFWLVPRALIHKSAASAALAGQLISSADGRRVWQKNSLDSFNIEHATSYVYNHVDGWGDWHLEPLPIMYF